MIITSVSEYQYAVADPDWHPQQFPTNFSRIYYVLGGEAYYFEENLRLRFKKDHLYILPTGRAYSMSHNPKDRIDHLFCHVTTYPQITSLIEVPVEEGSLLHQTLSLLKRNIKNQDYSIVLKMIDLVVASIDEENFVATYSSNTTSAIKNYIDHHFEEDISLDTICQKFFFSKSYVIRIFKKQHYVSPVQYLVQKRLDASIECLKSGMSITDISEKFYYSSPSAYSLSFKKRFGLSPMEFLKVVEQDKRNTKKFL